MEGVWGICVEGKGRDAMGICCPAVRVVDAGGWPAVRGEEVLFLGLLQ